MCDLFRTPPSRNGRAGRLWSVSPSGPYRRDSLLTRRSDHLAVVRRRADEPEADKVSNDRPDRPLQMPPASTEMKEAFDDFERFQRRGAWERALKALYTIPEDQAARFVDGENGFIIPVARKRRTVLAGLSPDGQAAYRLFYDSEAKKLLDEAEGPTEQEPRAALLGVFPHVGRRQRRRSPGRSVLRAGAVRPRRRLLAGHPPGASRHRPLAGPPDGQGRPGAWRGPDGDRSSSAPLGAGRPVRRREGHDRRPDGAGGRAPQAASLGELAPPRARTPRLVGGATARRPTSPRRSPPAWQLRFADSVEAGMTPVELTQWETTTLSGAVPAVAVDGQTLFANYLGHIFALDLASGKMLWRSASFHNLEQATHAGPVPDASTRSRFAILAAPGHVWSLGRDVKDPNYQAPFRLVCRRAENGEVIWKSTDLPDYAGIDFVGPPILADGTRCSSRPRRRCRSNSGQDSQPQQYVLAIQPHDGKLLWKTEVGIFRQGERYYWYYGHARHLAPAAAGLPRGRRSTSTRTSASSPGSTPIPARWTGATATRPIPSSRRAASSSIWNGSRRQASTPAASTPLPVGRRRADQGDQVGSALRDRPGPDEGPVGAADRQVGAPARRRRHDRCILGGPELRALDLRTRTLLWATRLPGRQQRRAPARAARRALAAHAPGHLRGRPAVGTCPADLPRQGPGRRGRRPAPDRPLAAGGLQSHDLGLPAQVGRGREARPRRHAGTTEERAPNE